MKKLVALLIFSSSLIVLAIPGNSVGNKVPVGGGSLIALGAVAATALFAKARKK